MAPQRSSSSERLALGESFDKIDGETLDASSGYKREFRVAKFWAALTTKVESIDFGEERAFVQVESKWFWRDNDFPRKLESREIELAGVSETDRSTKISKIKGGERVYGCFPTGDLRAFPVNPERMFENQVGAMERVPMSCWTRFNEADGDAVVSVQHVFRVTVSIFSTLKDYPADAVVIPLKLSIRQSRDKTRELTWFLDSSLLQTLQRKDKTGAKVHDVYKEDAYPINVRPTRLGDLLFCQAQVAYRKFDNKPSRPVACVVYERDLEPFTQKVVFPLWVIVEACLCAVLAVPRVQASRLSNLITGMLAVCAYKTAIADNLPSTPRVTKADWYINSCFGLLLVTVLETLVVALFSVKRVTDTALCAVLAGGWFIGTLIWRYCYLTIPHDWEDYLTKMLEESQSGIELGCEIQQEELPSSTKLRPVK